MYVDGVNACPTTVRLNSRKNDKPDVKNKTITKNIGLQKQQKYSMTKHLQLSRKLKFVALQFTG